MLTRFDPRNWAVSWEDASAAALALVLAVALAWLAFRLLHALARRVAARSESPVDDILVQRLRRPVKWAMMVLAVTLAAQAEPLLARGWEPLGQFLRPALLGWIAYALVKACTAVLELRLDQAVDPVAVRSRRTRIAILSRTATVGVVIITAGLMLLAIPSVRDIGTTLLASAGIAALAVGAAAQPALKSLIAGLQIAITEPLRLGDLVVIDGQTGRVEEVHLAYVVVRTWDERALIVPTARVLDQTFENWSRKNEMLTGPVYLHVDPATPVQPVREAFEGYVRAHPLWDGRTAQLLVTEARAETAELRLSVSARTIADLWTLRCAVREHMLGWLGAEMPGALIRHRLDAETAKGLAKPE